VVIDINLHEGLDMKQHLFVVAIASTLLCLTGVRAMTKDEYNVSKERIVADYKVAKARCNTLKGNAKDVCMKKAKGTEDVAKAELEQEYKPSPANARKVTEEKANAAFEVAKEKCDSQSGDAKSACVNQAKANHDKAKADIKAMKG